jgi:hypothetical protein
MITGVSASRGGESIMYKRRKSDPSSIEKKISAIKRKVIMKNPEIINI